MYVVLKVQNGNGSRLVIVFCYIKGKIMAYYWFSDLSLSQENVKLNNNNF